MEHAPKLDRRTERVDAAQPDRPRRSRLRVGAVDEPAECQADRAADEVMGRLNGLPGSSLVGTTHRPTRIRRFAVGVMGPQGGDVPDGVEARILAARSAGRPLDPGVRSPMERAFGADFGRIRLHDDAASGALNDELGAVAFTLGSDIFAHQPIDARSPGGQRLLAHELAHTLQQDGRGVVARTVRRAVGFEFEVGSWSLEALGVKPDAAKLAGTTAIPDADTANRLTKDFVVHKGSNFNLKPDQADDGSWHMEFVVEPPFQETSSGRSKLKSTMKAIEKFNDKLIDKGSDATIIRAGSNDARLLSEKAGLTGKGVLITPHTDMKGEPQTTGGVRLDQLADLMSIMATGAMPGETGGETAARQIGAAYLAYKSAADADLVASSPAEARARFADFPGRQVHSPSPPSNELISFLALARTYLVKAAAPMAYAKSIAPIMARTDFGAMFDHLPEAAYYRVNVPQWIALVLHVAGMTGQGNQPFFTGTSTYTDPTEWADVQAALSRDRWLRDITAGIDRVTEKHFPDPNVGGYLFGFGKLGTKTDVVGKRGGPTQTNAPVFELRRMAGSIDYRVWATEALELFDYFIALNRRQHPTFTGAQTRAKHMSV